MCDLLTGCTFNDCKDVNETENTHFINCVYMFISQSFFSGNLSYFYVVIFDFVRTVPAGLAANVICVVWRSDSEPAVMKKRNKLISYMQIYELCFVELSRSVV